MLQCLVSVTWLRCFTSPSRTSSLLPQASETRQGTALLPAGGCLLTAPSGSKRHKLAPLIFIMTVSSISWDLHKHWLVCDLFIQHQKVFKLLISEELLVSKGGLTSPPSGYTSVLSPQGHVSGSGFQPSQTSAQTHPPTENHSCTRLAHTLSKIMTLNTHLLYRSCENSTSFICPPNVLCFPGQLEQERKLKTGRLELLIDGIHYYVMVKICFLEERFPCE